MFRIFYDHIKRYDKKYKYVVNVPYNVKEAIKFDQENDRSLCMEVIGREISHIKDLMRPKPLKRATKAPSNHTFVPFDIF